MALFVLVMRVLKTFLLFIFLNEFSLYYVFLYFCVCFIMDFVVHAAFVCIKLMMMMMISICFCAYWLQKFTEK